MRRTIKTTAAIITAPKIVIFMIFFPTERLFRTFYPGPRLAKDILAVKMEKKFPKRAMPQIKFLANSLAGRPNVEFRTSRDICAKALAEEKARSPHKILRKEFYIECSCGFKGPALNDACRKCGAEIDFLPDLLPHLV
jgi:hypothetical protein